MFLINMVLAFFAVLTVVHFVLAMRKKYPRWRQVEAQRYFNGSIEDKNTDDYLTQGVRGGLALVMVDGKPKFKKQQKTHPNEMLK